MSDTLRARCATMLDEIRQDVILRHGSPVDDLMAFVLAEIGRKSDFSLDTSLPVCLYFGTDAERDKFIAVVQESDRNLTAKKLP